MGASFLTFRWKPRIYAGGAAAADFRPREKGCEIKIAALAAGLFPSTFRAN